MSHEPKSEYERWLTAVDQVIGTMVGLDHSDFRDYDFQAAYEEGLEAIAAAVAAMEEVGL